MRVGLMIPCYADVFYPEVGIATLELLENLGIKVEYPFDQTCCGQPMASSGCESDAPMTIITGLLQSSAVAPRFKTAKGFLNRQMARTVHFTVLVYFIVFILGHVAMVFTTGLIGNLNHITRGANDDSLGGLVLFLIGVALVVVAWLLATPLTLKFRRRR
jgi:hypothetical protein